MDGHPVVAGTVYAEMVVEAIQHLGHPLPIELNDVLFMTPCVVEPGRSRRLHLVLEPDDTGYRFDFTSRHPLPDGEPKWIHHVSGRVVTEPGPAPAPSVPDPVGALGAPQVHKGPMGLAGRSLCLAGMSSAEHAASAGIVLPDGFRSDLDTMSLHPALLDIAIGYVNMYASPVFRMPLAWRKLRLNRSLPARLTSHLRSPDGTDATQDTVTYDAVLVAEDGQVAAVVEELTMKRPSDLDSRLTALAAGTAADVVGYQPTKQPGARVPAAMVDDLDGGITAAEGAAAFARLLGRDLAPQVLITPRPLRTIAARFAASSDLMSGESGPTPARDTSHGRPAMMTEYVAPRTELETELVRHWQELLGFEPVGVHDNFAELGGHSLLGIRLAGRIRQSYDINLSLSALFQAPTVAGLADVIETTRRSPRG
jgi:acyl carrier protein